MERFRSTVQLPGVIALSITAALAACGGDDSDGDDSGITDGGTDASITDAGPDAATDASQLDVHDAAAEDAGAAGEATPDDFVGDWAGEVHVATGRALAVVLRIAQGDDGGFIVTLDSPDQGAFGIPGRDAHIRGARFLVAFPLLGGFLDVTREDEDLVGLFSQGASLPIRLSPTVIPPFARPQEEDLERDYVVREVSFAGGDATVTLAGELTLPGASGSFPAVVLVAGSEAEDRDMLLIDHRPYLILSDRLTRAGYATLRYDNRGRGGSDGDLEEATTEDLAADAAAALDFLRMQDGIDATRSGFVGHTEGAIAAVVAESDPAFAVLLASPTQPMAEVLMRRSRDIGQLMGTPEAVLDSQRMLQQAIFDAVGSAQSPEAGHAAVVQLLVNAGLSIEQAVREADTLTRPWLRWLLAYEPLPPLRALTIPVLSLYGERDLIVAADANAPDMEDALAHAASTVEVLPGLNHFFMPAEVGGPGEYADIEISFDEGAMQRIAEWLDGVAAP